MTSKVVIREDILDDVSEEDLNLFLDFIAEMIAEDIIKEHEADQEES